MTRKRTQTSSNEENTAASGQLDDDTTTELPEVFIPLPSEILDIPVTAEPEPLAPSADAVVNGTSNEELSKMSHSVQASIHEKLSKRDSTNQDPFIPALQLENEVKEIAKAGNFPLTRGTEAGARLMAKSKRNKS